MNLTGAVIEGSGIELRTVEGQVTLVHHDRRVRLDNNGVIDLKEFSRRRKRAPAGLDDLTGTGLLWVAQGSFSVRSKDMDRWRAGWMRILPKTGNRTLDELVLHVVSLQPQTPRELSGLAKSKRGSWSSWNFRTLFVPNTEQLDLLPIKLVPDQSRGLVTAGQASNPKPAASNLNPGAGLLGTTSAAVAVRPSMPAQVYLAVDSLPRLEFVHAHVGHPTGVQVEGVGGVRNRLEGQDVSIFGSERNQVIEDWVGLDFEMDL